MPKVLALLAHPDDAEIVCAGTLIRLKQEHGWSVCIATITAGDCGTTEYPPAEIASIREQEGANAARIMGAEFHCLREKDLRVFFDNPTVEKVTAFLQKIQPDLVLTHSPDDYHMDHEMTSRLVRAATFAAPIPNYRYGLADNQPLARIPHLYYCDPVEGKDAFGRTIEPTTLIDVSGQIETKAKMLEAHVSQRNWLIKHHGMDDYVVSMKQWCAQQGKKRGSSYAEGYRQHLGHSYPQDDILAALLS